MPLTLYFAARRALAPSFQCNPYSRCFSVHVHLKNHCSQQPHSMCIPGLQKPPHSCTHRSVLTIIISRRFLLSKAVGASITLKKCVNLCLPVLRLVHARVNSVLGVIMQCFYVLRHLSIHCIQLAHIDNSSNELLTNA